MAFFKPKTPVKYIPEIALFSLLIILCYFLFWRTFAVNEKGNIIIATKVWSDFAATFPLIRSFSYGNNFPPQYPIFPGYPIKYHFIYYLVVGILERFGIRIDLALNILSSLSFLFLSFLIFLFAKSLYKNKAVGILSVTFFIFNGSLGFLEFFKAHPPSIQLPAEIIKNASFSSFGPYDGKIVSAFWNLNIYTNQRHLSLSYALFIGLVYYTFIKFTRPESFSFEKAFLLGIIIGLLPFLHMAVFSMIILSLCIFILLLPKLRLKLLLTFIIGLSIAFPQIIYMGKSQIEVKLFNPGYLVENFNISSFIYYWSLNLGLIPVFSIVGFIKTPRYKKIFFIPFIAFFLIGNLFQFSPEIAANHKFFNLSIIGAGILSAYTIVLLFRKNVFFKLLVIPLILLNTLTGFIDLFPIINDVRIEIPDLNNNPTAAYIFKYTDKQALFLNTTYLFDPASIAGRKIFLGWPYFSWSAGYNTNQRAKEVEKMLNPDSITNLCYNLNKYGIDYIEIKNPSLLENTKVNYDFFEDNFNKIFYDENQNISIYNVKNSCYTNNQNQS